MRLLIVFCHPSPDSFGAAVLDRARQTLTDAGHTLRIRDLYAEAFDPVLEREEWERYLSEPTANLAYHADHIDDLKWAEGLIVIYPTWFYGPPAMLKGWLERVWLPGVAFEIPASAKARATGKLKNIRRFVGITTSGSPWWWLRVIRDPGRNLWMRGLRPVFHPGCRYTWCQLHSMNHRSRDQCTAFLDRVSVRLRQI